MPPPNDLGFIRYEGSFYSVITDAINDLIANGFDSFDRVEAWVSRIRAAAIRNMVPEATLQRHLNETMRSIYRAKVERGGMLKFHPGVSRFTLDRVRPALRSELDRRIMASAQLIKLNRSKAIEETLQRFSGWATSIPAGGSDAVDRSETKTEMRKALASLPYRERLVATDQGHKFVANLNNILATDAGALAAKWHSHAGEAGYDARKSHAERAGKVYLIRGCWAQERGFVKPGDAGYYDDVTAVGEEVNCRCWATYIYALRRLPADMLTVRGAEELERVKVAA
jgi:hypothetical protein